MNENTQIFNDNAYDEDYFKGLTAEKQVLKYKKGRPLGITPEEARKLEEVIEREFAHWADSTNCDMERLDNFYQLQQLALLNALLSGDSFALMKTTKRTGSIYDLRIALIEADRVSTPDVNRADPLFCEGVEKNTDGEVVAYHISKFHPLSFSERQPREWVKVAAFGEKTGRRNILHVMNRERIGQVRGVPFLSPVIETIKQLGRYTDAEVLAAVINGLFTVFIEKEGASDDVPFGESVQEELQVDTEDENSIELAPGAVIDLGEGEKANMVNPGRPNPNFEPFVMAVIKQIGAALEIPYEILIMAFTNNYSASRAAILEFFKVIKMYREFAAVAIYTRLKEHKAKIAVKIDGWCASAATIIAMAGDTIEISVGGVFMIHDPAAGVIGYYKADELKKIADELEVIKQSIVNCYMTVADKPEEEIKSLMTDETWYTGQEAVDAGFCTAVMFTEVQTEVENAEKVVVNSVPINISGFHTVPKGLLGYANSHNNITNVKNDKEEKEMTLEEFKTKHPDVANAYKTEIMAQAGAGAGADTTAAVDAERARIKAIDEITLPGYEDLANKAKYEEPVSAEAFAMQIVAAQKKAGQTFLNDREEDVKDSGVNDVNPISNNGGAGDEEDPYGKLIDEMYPQTK